MFRTLIYPSSGACDYSVELPHWSYWSSIRVAGCNTDTTPTQPHRSSNTHRTKNNTTNVVIQQNSRKLLMMDILVSETCWAHKKWKKIANDMKLVFYSSTITMMHGPINIGFIKTHLIWNPNTDTRKCDRASQIHATWKKPLRQLGIRIPVVVENVLFSDRPDRLWGPPILYSTGTAVVSFPE